VPLVAAASDLFVAHRPQLPAAPPRRWPELLALGLGGALGLGVLGRAAASRGGRWRSLFALCVALYGTATGLLGSLLLQLWACSDHLVAHRNANLLLVSPLSLVAGAAAACTLLGAAWAQRWARACSRLLGVCTLTLLTLWLFGLPQDVSSSLALLAPVQLSLAFLAGCVWPARGSVRVVLARNEV